MLRIAAIVMVLCGVARGDEPMDAMLGYVHKSWEVLRRDHASLLAAAVDPKWPKAPARWPVYVAADEDLAKIRAELRREMPPADFAKIALRRLGAGVPREPGILYVPRPYVVPGGRFNELYGWDSYFIVRGLLTDGRLSEARDLVDDQLYEVAHYGAVLNANRSYYLTRSQPPFLGSMVMAVFERTRDKPWLEAALPLVTRAHDHFTRGEHFTASTGLSRYFDSGVGPAPEVLAGEKDEQGRTHYERVRAELARLAAAQVDVAELYDAAKDRLTERFYVADRSMRESGFDPSNRFGPFNARVLDFDPVCLNSLLYVEEKKLAEAWRLLGHGGVAAGWDEVAARRAAKIEALMWDEGMGVYFDWDHVRNVRHPYVFATTFFPLWAGLASPRHAARVVKEMARLEAPGGLRTSTAESGMQWDSPYGWAPLQLIAFEGLRRYGYRAEADRLGAAFVKTVLQGFIEHNAIFEKYDVVHGKADVKEGLRFGYTSNEIGFGWTNAAVLEIWNAISRERHAPSL